MHPVKDSFVYYLNLSSRIILKVLHCFKYYTSVYRGISLVKNMDISMDTQGIQVIGLKIHFARLEYWTKANEEGQNKIEEKIADLEECLTKEHDEYVVHCAVVVPVRALHHSDCCLKGVSMPLTVTLSHGSLALS